MFDYKQLELDDEINKESKVDEKTKELKLTKLPKWLSSRNFFNEARKLINDIRADKTNSNQVLAMKRFSTIWKDW